MRKIMIFIVQKLKHDRSWNLDSAMTGTAIIDLVMTNIAKAIRGSFQRIGFRKAKGITFIGKHVTLRNKRYISVGRNFIAEDYCEIQGLSCQGIRFGDRVTVGRFAMIRPSGYYGGEIGEGLVVGNNSSIGAYCYIGCSGFISIGNNVMMAPNVSFHAENHNFEQTNIPMKDQGVTREPIIIEDDCWLATKSIILSGVTVGRGSVVAAGSIVTKDVPPYSIVGGIPAKVIKSRLHHEPIDSDLLKTSPRINSTLQSPF